MQPEAIAKLVLNDKLKVDELIKEYLYSDVCLVNDLGQHIINSGGKRLRPLIVLICAKACNYHGSDHLPMATVIEFIHTATLLHDDVVDSSGLRRGKQTANKIWGNQAAILVGDFLYSRAFQIMVKISNMEVLKIIANATNTIAEGEVLQLLNQQDPDTSQESYFNVIKYKTAKLFEAAAELTAVLSQSAIENRKALARYGLHLGTAYQLIDDLLDYVPINNKNNNNLLGKNTGADLAEGKPTLPVIFLLKHGKPADKSLVARAIKQRSTEDFDKILAAITSSGAIEYTFNYAQKEINLAKQALAGLPDSVYKQGALDLADFVVARNN